MEHLYLQFIFNWQHEDKKTVMLLMKIFGYQFNLGVMLLGKMKGLRGLAFSTLTVSEAQTRAKLIKTGTVRYNSHLTLHKGTSYQGLTNISFETQSQYSLDHLRIDFQGKKLEGLMINDKVLEQPSQYHREGTIKVPTQYLRLGQANNVVVSYQNHYDQDGNGCVSFIDTDQKQYLYTQFEPYYANRVFPLLDQPDIKAPLSLTLACPADWEAVLSNQFDQAQSGRGISACSITATIVGPYLEAYKKFIGSYEGSIPEDYKVTSFARTLPLSTYLYCFVVGPYKELVINSSPRKESLNIPMRLYSIESLYPELQRLAPYIEQVTVESMDFFQDYFGCKYPFSKYDQVFAHEYKWGAMENAGLVTLNDAYLFKDKVSDERMLSFGNTIVHELSHHWFGNLVTMKWWDDLWLNESFAEYISHFCLDKIRASITTLPFQSAMLSFFNRKVWGYSEDELVTTHSIRSPVPDTHSAESIFDGITYSKGAATMKQLMSLIGEEAFSKALTSYFHKHSLSNAVLDDLLASMEPFFQLQNQQLSLSEWKNMWLETPGTNILSCLWQPGQSTATITQTHDRPECATLRLHRIQVAIVLKDHSLITRTITVLPQAQAEVVLDVPREAVAVLLNYGDYTFAKVEIDSLSRSYFQDNLHKLDSSVSRSLVWKSYFDMVKDCRITSQQFAQFCLKNLTIEKSDPIFEDQLSKLYQAIALYTPKLERKALYAQTFTFLQELLLSNQTLTDNRKVILRDKLIQFCHEGKQAELLHDWYYGRPCSLEKEPLNNSLRWKIVTKLFSRGELSVKMKWALFEEMKARDSSDIMINKKISCQALAADKQQLETIYQNIFDNQKGRSLTNFTHQLRGFNHEIHEGLLREEFLERYFCDLKRLLKGDVAESERWFVEGDYLESFLTHFDPAVDASVKDLQLKRDRFRQISTSNQKLKRLLLKMIDVLERRIRTYRAWSRK